MARAPLFVAPLLALAAAAPAAPRIEPVLAETLAEVGRTRAVAFRLAAPAEADLTAAASVDDAGVLEVVRPLEVLAGERLGFLRVAGVRPGRTVLSVRGARVAVEVVAPRVPEERPYRLEVTTPAAGAALWGEVAVGCEWRVEPGRPEAAVGLELPDGRVLRPAEVLESGPHRHARFVCDVGSLPAGSTRLGVVLAVDDDVVAGAEVAVDVRAPADVLRREAEAPYAGDAPRRFEERGPVRARIAEACSGGAFVDNAGARPAPCFALDVPAPGEYQLVARARGTLGGGALPTLAVYVDDRPQPVTKGVLAGEAWHRVAVGRPFRLPAGARSVTVLFANDFYVPRRSDRNAYLDAFELVRVGGGAVAGGGMMMMDTAGGAAGRPRVAFAEPLEGRSVQGDLTVSGRVRVGEDAPTPRVTLEVNGRTEPWQRSRHPRFVLGTGHLRPGPNRLRLVAVTDAGARAESVVQTVWLRAPVTPAAARPFYRFTVQDGAWEPAVRDRLRERHGVRAAAFFSNGEATLRLPADVPPGRYAVRVEASGDAFEGPPEATVAATVAGERVALGAAAAPNWHAVRPVGEVDLVSGERLVHVAFRNDAHEPDVGDRNLFLRAVTLRALPGPDRGAPFVRWRYPPAGHVAHGLDAVVLEAGDDSGVAWADLLVDGRPTALRFPARTAGDRYWVLPLVLRDVAPGTHTLAVRVGDGRGRAVTTPARPLEVAAEPPAALGPHDRAVRLCNRLAFGPEPDQLGAILAEGEAAWLEASLAAGPETPAARAIRDRGALEWPVDRYRGHVANRVVLAGLQTPAPARAHLVHFVENHFSTWIRKARPEAKHDEHERFRRLGAAPFGDLLRASAESPAMLRYLDQVRSFAGRLNENYARELLELHTLGVDGGYDQEDVTTLARVLTGWCATREGGGAGPGPVQGWRFRFVPALNAGAAERVLGLALPAAEAGPGGYARVERVLEVLAAHPSTARFVAGKLVTRYLAHPPPAAATAAVARVFLETHGDLAACLRAVVARPAFFAPDLAPRVAPPLPFALRLLRSAGHANVGRVQELLRATSSEVFDRPTPDGYPEDDAAHASSNGLLQRWRFARRSGWMLNTAAPQPRWAAGEDAWGPELVDALCARFTGRLPGAASRRAALAHLAATADRPRWERPRLVAQLVCQLPESQLR